jgi:hypothetical protein
MDLSSKYWSNRLISFSTNPRRNDLIFIKLRDIFWRALKAIDDGRNFNELTMAFVMRQSSLNFFDMGEFSKLAQNLWALFQSASC